ncbi:hypothetical protein BZA77DRAFT_169048 [Pyronema omphalodes]|nr:hypothetical protein BZA77DRAFT_169048 [Pyronema omphalodes]
MASLYPSTHHHLPPAFATPGIAPPNFFEQQPATSPKTDGGQEVDMEGNDGISGGVGIDGKGKAGNCTGEVIRSKGVRLACLVNASVTVCGEDSIYAFGGFDQYTDEVFNHVLKLDLKTYTWTLVDNYGDIPSVRMGHTTTYWRDDKLIIFGGENELRVYLNDIYIFDIATATWSQPVMSGYPPCGRSRHAAVLHDDKLFVMGGVHHNPIAQPADYDADEEPEYNPQEVLDDICYLDLKTMTWSRSWKWVSRFDHQAWVREGKLWIFGGMGKEMDRTGELISLDLSHPVFARTEIKPIGYATHPGRSMTESTGPVRVLRSNRSYGPNSPRAMNTSRRHTPPPKPNLVPASTSSVRFLWGRDIPSEAHGTHFHHICGNTLLDFSTYSTNLRSSHNDMGLSALDLREMTWRKLSEGSDILGGSSWRWHYLAVSPNGTTAYLLGCPVYNEDLGEGEEYLSDVLPISLLDFGISPTPAAGESPSQGMLGFDLSTVFDTPHSNPDFTIRALKDEAAEGDEYDTDGIWCRSHQPDDPRTDDDDLPSEDVLGPPILCHKLILLSRWGHFTRVYNSRMREYHRGRLYLPEPYTVVRAFCYYLYTDSIATGPYCPDITTVAGLLVLANLYAMERLRTLCLGRLYNELDVESAAVVWERAGVAGEEMLRKKAAVFVLTYWGRIVRTRGFRRLSRRSLIELCDEVDEEGRIIAGEVEWERGRVEGRPEEEDEEMV